MKGEGLGLLTPLFGVNCLREHISKTKPGMAAATSWRGQINGTGGKKEGQMMKVRAWVPLA